jgi:hypothetical protein
VGYCRNLCLPSTSTDGAVTNDDDQQGYLKKLANHKSEYYPMGWDAVKMDAQQMCRQLAGRPLACAADALA